MTCSSRSAAATSSSVARNAATSEVRQPLDESDRVRDEQLATVGQLHLAHERVERDEQCVRRDGVVTGERVEKRRLAGVGVSDERDRRHRGLVPAFAQLCASPADRRRCLPERMLIRCRMRRRSVSSLVSPGPRVPMPPPSRESAVPEPTSRGIRYFSCASSTCSLPSRVRARLAKMSRINCVRSSTFRSSASSRLRSCAGDSSLSKMTTSARASSHAARERDHFAAAEKRRWIRFRASPASTRRTTYAPAASARPASSSSECSGSNWREDPLKSPTSAARSRVPFAVEREAEARITRAILARGPTRSRRRGRVAARASVTSTMRRRRTAWRVAAVEHEVHVRRAAAALSSGRQRAGGSPQMLALVAVMQNPNARARPAPVHRPAL